MKCNGGPESYAEKPHAEVSREKNQDHGNIINKECEDKPYSHAALILLACQPAGDPQGEQGNSANSTQDYRARFVKLLPGQQGNRDRRKRHQCKTG